MSDDEHNDKKDNDEHNDKKDGEQCDEEPNEKDIITKKIEIKTDATKLPYEDRLYVLEILKQQLPATKIIENADGCRINLDTLSDDIIHKIHHIVKNKLKIPAINLI